MSIYKKGDFVVVDERRVGLINRHFYEDGHRRYTIQFGADGPFEQVSATRIRFASENEQKDLEVGS